MVLARLRRTLALVGGIVLFSALGARQGDALRSTIAWTGLSVSADAACSAVSTVVSVI